MKPEDFINQIWAMLQAYRMMYSGEYPTRILLDPKLRLQLFTYNTMAGINPIEPARNTVFGLHIIEVYKPYPFIGLAKVITNEPSNA